MLIILGGVQASGKTTIQKAIAEAYPSSVALHRTDALREALINSPRDIGTSNHANTLYQILNEWDNILLTAKDDPTKIYTLDAGPITTIAYNVLSLRYALSSNAAWAHYRTTRMKKATPHHKLLTRDCVADLLDEVTDIATQYLQNSFVGSCLQHHRQVLAVYLGGDPSALVERFKERRSDIRENNMQDWFIDKGDEIESYKQAYTFAEEALRGFTKSSGGTASDLVTIKAPQGSISDVTDTILNIIRLNRYITVG